MPEVDLRKLVLDIGSCPPPEGRRSAGGTLRFVVAPEQAAHVASSSPRAVRLLCDMWNARGNIAIALQDALDRESEGRDVDLPPEPEPEPEPAELSLQDRCVQAFLNAAADHVGDPHILISELDEESLTVMRAAVRAAVRESQL